MNSKSRANTRNVPTGNSIHSNAGAEHIPDASIQPLDAPGEQHSILLVDDNEATIMMLRDYLEYSGFRVEVARNGRDGIALANKVRPHLILMDIQMPGLDGLEATRLLRSQPEFKTTPIIALTAFAMPNDRERCLAAGMDEYVAKPVNLKGTVQMVRDFLARAKKTE